MANSCCNSDKTPKEEEHNGSDKKNSKNLDLQSKTVASCCDSDKTTFDYLLWISFAIVFLFYSLFLVGVEHNAENYILNSITGMAHAAYDLVNTMALGALFGVIMVALLSKMPKELVISALGTNKGIQGLLRATGAGLLLDLCSHGILMVGAKLYERGVSTGQVMAFLIASPWNSFSLTLILIALIGLPWTLIYILLSILIAITTGYAFEWCTRKNILPSNPNTSDLPKNFEFFPALKKEVCGITLSSKSLYRFIKEGIAESKMVLRWLLFGIVLASLIRVFVPEDIFGTYFGPTLIGLAVTLGVATVLEVCSEGSTPIAADIFNRAGAPGNSFAFLMTGVSTDYTEIMVLKDTTKSWKMALFLPLITLPQIVLIALLINTASV